MRQNLRELAAGIMEWTLGSLLMKSSVSGVRCDLLAMTVRPSAGVFLTAIGSGVWELSCL